MVRWFKHILLLYLGLLVTLQASGQLAMPDTVCAGDLKHYWVDPTPGSVYTWQINGVTQSSATHEMWVQWDPPWTPAGSPYVVTVQEQSSLGCSGDIRSGLVVVRPLMPVSVTVTADLNPACPGTMVTFTATAVNGGVSPVYLWEVNGLPAGTNSPTYSYVPLNGDVVTCRVTSDLPCAIDNPALSNQVVMNVSLIPVSVSITASANNVCEGIPVTFTAVPVNGGTLPFYQWYVNGNPVGPNLPVYTYSPANNDLVVCVVTSNNPCPSGNPATSNTLLMVVRPAPYVALNICTDITTRNAQPFTLRGGVPPGGVYSGTGVAGTMFNPSLLPLSENSAVVTYTVLGSNGCRDSLQHTITVNPSPPFVCGSTISDVRDGKSYPTIVMGTQCWLAVNLDFGQQVTSAAMQRDNCINEKYCYNDLAGNCSSFGGLYQWDEVMQYEDTQAIQGICPPEWHIPTEAEWNLLFAFCGDNAHAGDLLRTGGSTGFDALLTGGRFANKKWDLDQSAFFWSSTPHGPYKAWAHSLNSINHGMSTYPSSRANSFSVRCVKD